MHVDVRPVAKLRNAQLNLPAALSPIIDALVESPLDLSRLRLACDWIQYRNNFRDVVGCRPILSAPAGADDLEIAVDLRRCDDAELAVAAKQALAGHADGTDLVAFEPWVPLRESCIWRFNALYWQALSAWEEATGQEYEQALPGGESDARNVQAARDLITELFGIWDDLDARRALPEELYVVELGVGNGNQARTWLDTFAELDRAHGRDYYRRLHYLMGDYSPHVLERARSAVAHHGDHVSALVLDATNPTATLGFLRGKAFLVYISNVYDNLPTDEVATIQGRTYLVQAQAHLRPGDADAVARRFDVPVDRITAYTDKLLRLGPELLSESLPHHFADRRRAVEFWQAVWSALRLRERYVPVGGLDQYQVTPSVNGEILRPLLEVAGDIRLHASNGAVSSFADTLPLLHPYGRLVCHDLFVTDWHRYHTAFCGPGKYDGSVVNWVNGPLLRLLGNRRGFDVQITPFAGRPSSNVKTLTAQVRD